MKGWAIRMLKEKSRKTGGTNAGLSQERRNKSMKLHQGKKFWRDACKQAVFQGLKKSTGGNKGEGAFGLLIFLWSIWTWRHGACFILWLH